MVQQNFFSNYSTVVRHSHY